MSPRVKISTECAGIADQLQRAFYGSAWHGPAVMELLEDVDATTAAAKPLRNVHSIWELLLHIAVWDAAALVRLSGTKCQPEREANFPPVNKASEAAWRRTISDAKRTHDRLVKTVSIYRSSDCATAFRGRGTTSITCFTASRSMSSIMRDRLPF
jgi:hypothetical protein